MAVKYDPTIGYAADSDPGLWDWLTGGKNADPTGGGDGAPGVTGHKPGDTYRDEYGDFVTVQPNGQVLPYRAAPAQSVDRAPSYDGQGRAYIVGNDGKPQYLDVAPQPVNPHPGTSYSFGSSTSQSLQDPAVLAETIRVNNATIERNAKQDALALQQQQYLERKDAWAQKNSDASLALQTQTQLAQVQQQRESLNFQMQQAQQRSAEAQQQLTLQVDQFNTQERRATDSANLEASDRKAARLQQVNTDIGKLGADTGDRGQWASFVTANKGWGADNAALAGSNFITDASTAPLEGSLQQQAQIKAQPDKPFSFNPIALSPIAPVAGPLAAAMPQNVAQRVSGDTNTFAGPVTYGGGVANDYGKNYVSPDSSGAGLANLIAGNTADLTNAGYKQQIPGMEDGGAIANNDVLIALASILGMEPKAVAGEKGKANGETVMSNGDVVILPDKGKLASGKKKMATGGLSLGNSPLSLDFLTEASKKARSGTPLEGSNAPVYSPVYASSPGFNPSLAGFYDSIRALEQGVPVEYSSWLTNRYRPSTVGEQIVRRSA